MIILIITAFIASLGATSATTPFCARLFSPMDPVQRWLYERECKNYGWRTFSNYFEDSDECSKPHLNKCSHTCHNTLGSYTCSCRTGYVLINGYECEDIDECSKPHLNKCSHRCHNTLGSYTCSCPTRYVLINRYECEGSTIIMDDSSPERRITVVERSTARLKCTVITGDGPIRYHWLKNGLPFLTRGKTYQILGRNYSMLLFSRVSSTDAGRYMCVATNEVSSANETMQLIVNGVVPYFSQAPLSYMQLPTLSGALRKCEIEIAFKPESMNGLMLYNGQKEEEGDFISLVLNNGYVEFRFDLGSGIALLRSNESVAIGRWHRAHISREMRDGSLKVDDQPEVTGFSPGVATGLNLVEPMYIGAVPNIDNIPSTAGSFEGFVGCISQFKTGNVVHNLSLETETYGISACETCSDNPCPHGRVCEEALTMVGYNCTCPPGFSGRDCETVGEACYPGVCKYGQCINRSGGGFDCNCPPGMTGVRCERVIHIILSPERRITVNEGSRAFLECRVIMEAGPIRYHWLKNGLTFLAHGETSEMSGLAPSVLTFDRASLADAGRYACFATDEVFSRRVVVDLIVNAVRCPSVVVPHHTIVSCYKPDKEGTNWNSGSENDISRSDTSYYRLNTICTFKCKSGYDSSVLPGAIKCQADRKWNGTIPECT